MKEKEENNQTDEQKETDETPVTEEKKTRSSGNRKTDYFLEMHVIAANNGLSFSITLNVGGILISGYLIGGKQYFQEFGQIFQDAHPDDSDRKYEKSIQALGDVYDTPETNEPPEYIHLKYAKFYSGGLGSGSPKGGALWRGRIDNVDGFILGMFQDDSK